MKFFWSTSGDSLSDGYYSTMDGLGVSDIYSVMQDGEEGYSDVVSDVDETPYYRLDSYVGRKKKREPIVELNLKRRIVLEEGGDD